MNYFEQLCKSDLLLFTKGFPRNVFQITFLCFEADLLQHRVYKSGIFLTNTRLRNSTRTLTQFSFERSENSIILFPRISITLKVTSRAGGGKGIGPFHSRSKSRWGKQRVITPQIRTRFIFYNNANIRFYNRPGREGTGKSPILISLRPKRNISKGIRLRFVSGGKARNVSCSLNIYLRRLMKFFIRSPNSNFSTWRKLRGRRWRRRRRRRYPYVVRKQLIRPIFTQRLIILNTVYIQRILNIYTIVWCHCEQYEEFIRVLDTENGYFFPRCLFSLRGKNINSFYM